ncbi:MobF family relaxase [Corynebacterium oculi]|uniref:ATP-dependent RecD-like DNA helicase n=1 Tax=Corynebacterium oculi TaxID=1544416 RepID=A0A0Q0YNN6_9CORY|nr:MobF family relaxase [Corynebacterium oculi]KQB84059.1 ATP-dependent RecD-like DNA helicase [Corynebacterium oculi]
MKKLTAGDGYLYLTRQVASADGRRQGQALVDYYSAHGMPEGTWWGKGAAALGIEGVITEEQMAAAFGEFLHPNADEKIPELLKDGHRIPQAIDAVRLGRRAPNFNKEVPFLAEFAARKETFIRAHGRVPTTEEREHIETLIAKDMMETGHHDPAEVRFFIAEQKRKAHHAVAGYDLVFTPMKSVSVLWAIGDDATRKAIMRAHHEAVDDTLSWIEDNALYTRAGAQGVKKLDCEGMIAAKFVHWDNRAGDPNLHTHCAILNRVLSEGKHRTIDGTVLYRHAVTASEHYNNRVKELVEQYAGVSFSPVEKRGKRPVWEINGIPEKLMDAMSRRRDVLAKQRELIENYRANYGREPSKSVQIKLAEQANLETRSAKAEPKSLKEMVAGWRKQANEISQDFTTASVLKDVFSSKDRQHERTMFYDPSRDDDISSRVLSAVEKNSSTWTSMRVESEIYRQISAYKFANLEQKKQAVTRLLNLTLEGKSICVDQREIIPGGPKRQDGESIFVSHGSRRYTSEGIIQAEQRLTNAASQWLVNTSTEENLAQTLTSLEEKNGYALSNEQTDFVRHLLFSPARIAVGIGAAGTGKTTAMEAFARAVEADGRTVVGLAPSAKAAEVLGESLGVEAQTLASLITKASHTAQPEPPHQGTDEPRKMLGSGDVLLIDEAGMASTKDLDAVLAYATKVGAFVRMVGDPDQLASVDTGGILEEIATLTDAPVLREVRRFKDPEEAAATLKLRDGNSEALDWYFHNDRIVTGLREELPGAVFQDWCASTAKGNTAIMIAGDNVTVDALNEMARNHFIDTGIVTPEKGEKEVEIYHGRHAAHGDVVVTRANNGKIRFGYNNAHRVKNGDLWTVIKTHKDGGLRVQHHETGNVVELPANYVKANVELGYASTVHRSQGMTVDESFFLPSPKMDRQGLYVGLTRGKTLNRIYVPDDEIPDLDDHSPQMQPPSAREVLESILTRDGRSVTARAILEQADAPSDFATLSLVYTELSNQLICDTVADSAHRAGYEQAAELLRDDWQTPRLGSALATINQQRSDNTTLLTDAIERAWHRFEEERADNKEDWIVARDNDNTDSPTESLAFLVRMELSNALGEDSSPITSDDDLWSITGLNPPLARDESMDPEIHQAMSHAAQGILQRLEEAADHAVAHHPTWVTAIGDYRPEDEDYHEKWVHAVRLIAAGREIGDTNALAIGQQDIVKGTAYHDVIQAVRRAGERSPQARYESMGRNELERFLQHCDNKAAQVASQAKAWEMRAKTIDQVRPHEEAVRTERLACLETAEHAAPIIQSRQIVSQYDQQVAAAQAQLQAAHKEGIFTRGRKIKDATTYLEAVTAARDKEAKFYQHLCQNSTLSFEEIEKATALAHNDGHWARRFQQAQRQDQEIVDQASQKARKLRTDEGLWQQRSHRIADKLEENRPLTHKEAQVYIQKIKEILNRKPPAGVATSLDGSNPYSLDAADDLVAQLATRKASPQATPTSRQASHQQRHELHTENDMEL